MDSVLKRNSRGWVPKEGEMVHGPLRLFVAIIVIMLAAAFNAEAQQSRKAKRIVIVSAYSDSSDEDRIEAFRKGLRDLGYTDGSNVVIGYWNYGGLSGKDREARVAAELPTLEADVIVVSGGSGFTRDIKQANTKLPIVMTTGSD